VSGNGILQLHESERLAALAQRAGGKLLIWVAVAVLLTPFVHTEVVLPAVILTTLFPARRRALLSLAAVYVLANLVLRRSDGMAGPAVGVWSQLGAGAVLAGASYLLFRCARSFDRLPAAVRRHPLLWLHLGFWCLAAVLWKAPAGSALWRFELLVWGLLPLLLWRASFLLLAGKRGRAADTSFGDHLFYLWPAFGGTDVPFGKGFDYLARHEASSSAELARSQLAGLKLLVLACLWFVTLELMGGVVHGVSDDGLRRALSGFSLNVPPLGSLLRGELTTSVPMAWLALYVELVRVCLALAVIGHVVVGSLRLLGFNVFRNTYKPLLAESIVDFWNRFYFYFKELLVELWFYPTYLSTFRKHPRLRTFTAVFAAAFVGNLYYHVLRDRDLVARADLDTLIQLHAPRAFYCLLLTTGIFLSMLRQQSLRGAPVITPPSVLARLRRIAGVWTFFALIHIWAVTIPGVGIGARFDFVLHLLGLGGASVHP